MDLKKLVSDVCAELNHRGVSFREADVFGFVSAAQPSDDTTDDFADGWEEANETAQGENDAMKKQFYFEVLNTRTQLWDRIDGLYDTYMQAHIGAINHHVRLTRMTIELAEMAGQESSFVHYRVMSEWVHVAPSTAASTVTP